MPMDVRLLLENTLPGLGYELVDFELTPGGGFRVFIDKPGGITVEDCVSTSNHLTRLFMVENIDYDRLEVSSPGLDRPLKKEADYVRFQGSLAKVRTRLPVEQQKRFMGRIAGIQDSVLQLQLEDGRIVAIPLSNIDKARLEPEF
ncbi:ribosome maturation factor RimP [Vogesella indigofera]|uniref:Ribosome maturation factor RimP n=3 Tax=Vogesella TaxID=57739 RepID=A0A495B5P0_VOGIN|nr:ribosome maturation factor RimP [Vogesella indigofera]